MKKILFVSACALLVTSISCKKDDNESLIVGTWTLNKYVTQYGNGTGETETPDACEAKSNLIFASNKNLASSEFYKSGTTCLEDKTSGTYSYDEPTKLLTMILDGDSSSSKVETLNGHELVFIAEEGDFDGDGKSDKFLVHLKR